MRCPSCEPDYCACADFYAGRLAYWKGEMMADNTKIEWADATVNAINGCSLASPGCTNCYAMRLAGTRMKHHPSRAGLTQDSKAGPVWTGEVRLNEKALLEPLPWKRPRRIFWNAHGDTFHDAVPDEWIDRMFAVCALTPQHTHMILTKRSARMRAYMTVPSFYDRIAHQMNKTRPLRFPGGRYERYNDAPLPNVWLGVSVEDQTRANERIPDLLATPAAIRFISAEPLLGQIDLRNVKHDVIPGASINALRGQEWSPPDPKFEISVPMTPRHWTPERGAPRIDWVIVGGESGPGARPMHPGWARSLRDQCADAGVPFHFKQWGEFAPAEAVANASGGVDFVPPLPMTGLLRWQRWDGDECRKARKDESVNEFFHPGTLAVPVGKKAAGRLLDGIEHNGVPA
ncbi:MAG: hypothetical protein RLZZ475_2403 [Pseudomonadota bacterium]|jgi:protein gp37